MTNFDDLCSLISSKVPYADLPYQNKTGVGHLLKDKYQQYLNATNTYLTIEPEICRNLLDAWESYINDPDEAYKQFSNAMRFIEEDILAVSKYYRKLFFPVQHRQTALSLSWCNALHLLYGIGRFCRKYGRSVFFPIRIARYLYSFKCRYPALRNAGFCVGRL